MALGTRILPTVHVLLKDKDGKRAIIGEADFDPGLHELVDPEAVEPEVEADDEADEEVEADEED